MSAWLPAEEDLEVLAYGDLEAGDCVVFRGRCCSGGTTHQGAVSHEHLDYFLDEFMFRFDRRTSRRRGKLFCRSIQHAATVAPVPYKEMVKHARGRKTGDRKM